MSKPTFAGIDNETATLYVHAGFELMARVRVVALEFGKQKYVFADGHFPGLATVTNITHSHGSNEVTATFYEKDCGYLLKNEDRILTGIFLSNGQALSVSKKGVLTKRRIPPT